MKKFNFYIEPDWLKKLNEKKKAYGFSSVSAFLRYIIIKFFKP